MALLLFSIIISLIETIGISIIMPFISIATDFNLIHENKYYNYIYTIFNFENEITYIMSFGTILICFYILRSIINLLYFYSLNKFTQGRYHLLAYRLFENYLGMPYKDFINKNSSTLTKTIVNEAAHLTLLISAILFMFSEVFVIVFINAMLLFVNYKITVILTLFLAINAIIMIKTISRKIKKAGIKREIVLTKFYEIINRSFGNFKLIKLKSKGDEILKDFGRSSYSYAEANITNATLNHVPRLFLEAIAFGVIIFIITYMVWKTEENISNVLPIVSMFVLALYRLMPSVNRIMTSYNQILYFHKSLDIVHTDLMYDNENLGNQTVKLENKIVIKDMKFEYENNVNVLNSINLTIKIGSKIAFIGESGSGKSTLVDLLIGLYKPNSGNILADGIELDDTNIKAWRSKVGYIPQTVYLFDGTVGENIAFGEPYDKEKIDDCLKKAKIYDFLYGKKGQKTLVGEGGILLSGGQKQRIAIARALYTSPEILVLDEATSALDDDTEKQIMNEIYDISNGKTLIIIAHRLTTLDRCEKIYKLENGELLID